ncbi:MAG: transcriptional regulator [Sorangium cellulosum]|nr:MAG: transcriptional regulator [Sorangium cellulosum]
MPTRVLIICAEASRRRALAGILMNHHDVLTAEETGVGLSFLSTSDIDVVVAEAACEGEAFVEHLAATRPGVEVILLTPDSSDMVTRAFHVLPRAFASPSQVAWTVDRACERKRLRERVARLEKKVAQQERSGEIIGTTRVMEDVFDLAYGAAVASSPTLLVGESGTGKEMLARAMHRLGRRSSGPFVAVDCASLPPDRIEQELFGSPEFAHSRPLVLSADGGTLFLADITALPPAAQARLVQLLQYGEVDNAPESSQFVDLRVIATTTSDLKPHVSKGSFRQDLFFHLNMLVIRVPPLRRRKDDIPVLAYHFLHRHAQRVGRRMKRIGPEALRLLREHRWAGNVRELDHAMERAVVLARSEVVLPADLAFLKDEEAFSVANAERSDMGAPRDTSFDPSLFDMPYPEAKKRAVATFEQAYVRVMLDRAGNNVSEAARQSGLDRSNFRRVMKKNGR